MRRRWPGDWSFWSFVVEGFVRKDDMKQWAESGVV